MTPPPFCLLGGMLGAGPPGRVFTPQAAFDFDVLHVGQMAFSPDGKRLAVGGLRNSAREWRVTLLDLATGKANAHLGGLGEVGVTFCWRPDGKEMAGTERHGNWVVWD